MHLVYLTGENTTLAKAEAISQFGKPIREGRRILIFDSHRMPKHLAYTREIMDLFYSGKVNDILNMTEKFDWNINITGTYALRTLSHGIPATAIADIIWKRLKDPKVDLKEPDKEIGIVTDKKRVYIGRITWENPKDFSKRRSHLRPKNHPISLDPRLARACINLLGNTCSVLDPFCGTGGILIEAGLMGKKITGFDNNKKMLDACKKNLEHFRLDFRLKLKDARYPDKRYRYIVTDLPYGKNTKKLQKDLYETFIRNISHAKRAVVIFPDKRYIHIAKRYFEVEHFTYYIHKSMTKHILLLKTPG